MRAASLTALLIAPLYAQTHRVAAPERVTRAIAVYEWTGELAKPAAARLVPVALFIDGHLKDAGVYLTRPVPFALQTGNVYSVEEAGSAKGTVALDYARDVSTRRSATDDNPVSAWFGYGNFVPTPAEPKAPALHASAHPAVIVASSDPDRPHRTRRADSTPSTGSTGDVPADDPDRPTLRHRDPRQDAQRRKEDSGSGVTGMGASLNDDPNRPTMRRGKPAGSGPPSELKGMPPNLHQVTAVSDAVNREPHLFTREWATPIERAQTLVEFEALAQPGIAAYAAANHLDLTAGAASTAPSPKAGTTAKKGGHRSAAAKSASTAPVRLSTEQLTSYTLSYDGLPTFVYTAEVPLAANGPMYLTWVAQRLPSGELQTALSSVTDAGHLDRTPWMRLVDAVDPDAGHRASLLFELREQSTRQFALYRLVSARAEQQFVTGVIE